MIIWACALILAVFGHHRKVADFQLQQKNVCFGAKDSKFGSFTIKKKGIITTVKLVHRSGKISCYGGSGGLSNFGCNQNRIETLITGDNNQIMFPEKVGGRGEYVLPGYTDNSHEIVLDNPNNNAYVSIGQHLRIWYGEDYKKRGEGDNQGRSCVDVYVIIRPVQFKIQKEKVCFGAKDSSYGTFKLRQSGTLTDLKLVYKSGYVSCRSGKNHWGCGDRDISLLLTGTDDRVIFPKNVVSYKLPTYNANSEELVINNPNYNPVVKAGQELRLWHGEDLKNHWEGDNHGTTCADVYAAIRPTQFKLQESRVCFGAKGSSYGRFKIKSNGILRSLKLQHKSGQVKCSRNNKYLSNFGCGGENIEVLITTIHDKVVLPGTLKGTHYRYQLPGKTSKSKSIVLNNPIDELKVRAGDEFRVWYGEDRYNRGENDNGGESCVDVFADIYTEYIPRCQGEDNDCCTADKPCLKGEGDCDSDKHCAGNLKCGTNNCPWGDKDDCCM